MAALASDRLRHFRLLLWNRWTEFKETCQEASSQRPLQSLCFGPIGKTTWRPWPLIGWDIFYFSSETALNGIQWNLASDFWELSTGSRISTSSTKFVFFGPIGKTRWPSWPLIFWEFSTSPLKPLNGIQWSLTGSKISKSSTKFVFFGPIGKTRWPPWPLIGWDIFDFSSETAERNSRKLVRKHHLNVLYKVCVLGRSEKQHDGPGLWLAETFFTSPLKPLNGIQWNLTGSRISNVLYQVCVFRADRKNKMAVLASDFLRIFDFSSETAERNSMKLDRKQDFKVLYQVCVFRADRKNKMAALASDRLRHFRLLLWNRWTEFKETCQEASSQRPLQSLCFGPIGKTTWRPWPLIGWDIFYFSSETAERNSMKLDRKQDLNVLYQVCVFRADRKKKWPSWPLIFWDIFDFSSETAERNSMKLDSKQDFKVLYQVCVFRADRKNKMAALASDRLRHFRLLLWNHWTEFNETCQEARSQRPLPSLCSLGRSENKIGRPGCFFKRLHIVLRCTICGPLGLLFNCLGYAFTCHIWKVWAAVLT